MSVCVFFALSYLVFVELLESFKFMSFIKCGRFSTIIFSKLFFCTSLFSNYGYTEVRTLRLIHRLLGLWTVFFSIFFSLCSSDWIISIALSSSLQTLSSVISILLLNPCSEFLFQILHFSVLKFHLILFLCCLLINSTLSFISCVFSFISNYNSCLKVFDSSGIWIIVGWQLLIIYSFENCSHFSGFCVLHDFGIYL